VIFKLCSGDIAFARHANAGCERLDIHLLGRPNNMDAASHQKPGAWLPRGCGKTQKAGCLASLPVFGIDPLGRRRGSVKLRVRVRYGHRFKR
jgi:hypothetical protein